jgi:mRNA interferase RelE/StbE
MSGISFREGALQDLLLLQKSEQQRVFLKLLEILAAQQALGEPLRNSLQGYWKVRIGSYRLVYRYEAEGELIEIVAVGKREDAEVYKTASFRIS